MELRGKDLKFENKSKTIKSKYNNWSGRARIICHSRIVGRMLSFELLLPPLYNFPNGYG